MKSWGRLQNLLNVHKHFTCVLIPQTLLTSLKLDICGGSDCAGFLSSYLWKLFHGNVAALEDPVDVLSQTSE